MSLSSVLIAMLLFVKPGPAKPEDPKPGVANQQEVALEQSHPLSLRRLVESGSPGGQWAYGRKGATATAAVWTKEFRMVSPVEAPGHGIIHTLRGDLRFPLNHISGSSTIVLFEQPAESGQSVSMLALAVDDEWKASARESRRKNPVPSDESTIAAGKIIYQKDCIACHGTTGKGDGPAAKALPKPCGDLSDPKMADQTDGALYWKISEGKSPMPAFDKLLPEDKDRWKVINYLRTLAPQPKPAAAQEKKQDSSVPQPAANPADAPGKKQDSPVAQPTAKPADVPEKKQDTPVSQPATKPADTPGKKQDSPVSNPTAKPADTPEKKQDTPVSQPAAKPADSPEKKQDNPDLQEQVDELEKQLKGVKEKIDGEKSGWTKVVLTGYGFAGFEALKGSKSSFTAGFNPIFLWQPTDRLFFEAEMELGLDNTDTSLALEYATLSYILNDYITIGAGRFLTPFGTFFERLHPAWINKLPDKPFAYDDGGIPPGGTLGVEIRGGWAIGESSKLNYAVYAGNSARLETDTTEAGILFDDNFTDTKDSKNVGARLGILPFSELEFGYSVLGGKVGPSGTSFSGARTLMHGPDFAYLHDSEYLQGTFTVFGQWTWSSVTTETYGPTADLLVPVTFANRRSGGYAQMSYRPSRVELPFLKNLEAIVRYDALHRPPQAPESVTDQRWTLGLDYWITSSAVFKLAYEWDNRTDPAGAAINANGVLVQFAMGF